MELQCLKIRTDSKIAINKEISIFLKVILLNYRSFHFRPSSQHPPTPPTHSLPPSSSLRAVRVSCPVGSSSSSPLPPGPGRWVSKQTGSPKSSMQRKQVPVSLSMAFQKGSGPVTFRESGHIQKIWLDHVLLQSQSNWPWWTLIRSEPLYQWVMAPLAGWFHFSFSSSFCSSFGPWGAQSGAPMWVSVCIAIHPRMKVPSGLAFIALLLCSLSFCFSFGPRELSPVFQCGSLSLSPSIARWRFWHSCLFTISRRVSTWFSSGSPSYLASLGSRIIGSKTFNYG